LHFFNDLVLNKAGDVFITDMEGKAIYIILHDRDILELFTQPANFTDPNGISISSDEKKLFVAHREGISSVDITTGATTLLRHPEQLRCNGIDGLYFYKNSLVAVQNAVNRVIQYYLKPTMDEIIRYRVIEENHPFFTMNPTTGTVAGNQFYYIANSQFGSFDEQHQIYPMERLYDVVILKAKLDE
jgi:hypothetical protein